MSRRSQHSSRRSRKSYDRQDTAHIPTAAPAGPYSPGLAAGEWVSLAGQTGTGETIEDQAEDTIGRLAVLLGAAGCIALVPPLGLPLPQLRCFAAPAGNGRQ